MAPTIPSPTPIQGIKNPDGSTPLGKRLPLAELQQNDFAFALYAQALLAWQQDGGPTKDSDAKSGTSYFQVTGMMDAFKCKPKYHAHVLMARRYPWCSLRLLAGRPHGNGSH